MVKTLLFITFGAVLGVLALLGYIGGLERHERIKW